MATTEQLLDQYRDAWGGHYNDWGNAYNSYVGWGNDRGTAIGDYADNVFGGINSWSYGDFLTNTRKKNTDTSGAWGTMNSYQPYFYDTTYDWLGSEHAPDQYEYFAKDWTDITAPGTGKAIFNQENDPGFQNLRGLMDKHYSDKDWINENWLLSDTYISNWQDTFRPVFEQGVSADLFSEGYDPTKALNAYLGQDALLNREDFDTAYSNISDLYTGLDRYMGEWQTPELATTHTVLWPNDTWQITTPLPSYQQFDIDPYMDQLGLARDRALSRYDEFDSRVRTDERGIQSRYETLANQLAMDQATVRGLDINNIDSLADTIRTQLENQQRQVGTYSNDLYDWIQADGGTFDLSNGQTFADARSEVSAGYDDLLAQLDQLAEDRDAQIANYDQFLANMRTNAEALNDRLAGFGLMDWYNQGDDINTTLRDYRNQIADYETDLNTADFTSINTLLDAARATGDQLQGDFDTEMSRYESNQGAYRSNLYDLLSTMGTTDWFNKSALDQQLAAANSIGNQITNYNSDISELFDWTTSRGLIDQITDLYNTNLGQYNTEDQRVEDFRGDIRSQLDALMAQIGGVDTDSFVNAQNTLGGYEDQLDSLQRLLRDFESELNPTFDISNNMLSDARGDIGDALVDANKAQLAFDSRISDSGYELADLERLLNSLETNGERLDYRLLSSLDAFSNDLDEFGTERGLYDADFNSLLADAQALGYDPYTLESLQNRYNTIAGGDLSGLQSQYDDAWGQRTTELDALLGQLDGYSGSLEGMAATDEQGMLDLTNQLQELIAQGAVFDGGRADTLATDSQALYDSIGERLSGLYGERDTIESDAKSLLSEFLERQYYDQGVVDSDRALLDALLGRIDEWGADQARDEFAAADTRLNAEGQRIQADAERARQAREAEANRYQRNTNNTITPEELAYLANWLNNRSRTDEYQYFDNAFARAMGLGG